MNFSQENHASPTIENLSHALAEIIAENEVIAKESYNRLLQGRATIEDLDILNRYFSGTREAPIEISDEEAEEDEDTSSITVD